LPRTRIYIYGICPDITCTTILCILRYARTLHIPRYTIDPFCGTRLHCSIRLRLHVLLHYAFTHVLILRILLLFTVFLPYVIVVVLCCCCYIVVALQPGVGVTLCLPLPFSVTPLLVVLLILPGRERSEGGLLCLPISTCVIVFCISFPVWMDWIVIPIVAFSRSLGSGFVLRYFAHSPHRTF